MKGPDWFKRVMSGVTVEDVQRFDGAFDAVRTELGRRGLEPEKPWSAAAHGEVDNAVAHRDDFKLESAWPALKSAHREMVRSYDPAELVSEARIVRREAEHKLSDWRKAAIGDLLPTELIDAVSETNGGLTVTRVVRNPARPPERGADAAEVAAGRRAQVDPQPPAIDPEDAAGLVEDLRIRVVRAKLAIDTNSDNVYHKFRLLRRAVISTSIAIGAALALLTILVALEWVPSSLVTDDSPLGSWRLLLVVMTLGMIGAFVSSATELRNPNQKVSIPDLRVGYTLMGMRPVAGAMGATVVIVILQSALGNAVELQSTAILGVAVAAGFTERLVTRTVTTAADAVGK